MPAYLHFSLMSLTNKGMKRPEVSDLFLSNAIKLKKTKQQKCMLTLW